MLFYKLYTDFNFHIFEFQIKLLTLCQLISSCGDINHSSSLGLFFHLYVLAYSIVEYDYFLLHFTCFEMKSAKYKNTKVLILCVETEFP